MKEIWVSVSGNFTLEICADTFLIYDFFTMLQRSSGEIWVVYLFLIVCEFCQMCLSAPIDQLSTDICCRRPHPAANAGSVMFRADGRGSTRDVVGRGRRGTASPHFFDRGDASPTPPSLFWTEIRAKVSPLLQLVTY